MRVAVIGCGSIGTRHARNLKALGHWVSTFDTDAEKAFSLAVECHGDPKTAAFCPTDNWRIFGPRDRFDAVFICTPASTHGEVASELLELGYIGPLYVEKPLATSIDEAEIFRVWPNLVLMVGYNWRWNFEVGMWWKAAATGQMPTRVSFQCETDYASWPGSGYGDPVLECSHEIDLAYALLGESLRLTRAQRNGPAGLILDFINDDIITATVDLHWAARQSGRRFTARAGEAVFKEEPSQASIDLSYIDAVQHFLSCIEAKRRPDCSMEDGIRVLQLLPQIVEKLQAVTA